MRQAERQRQGETETERGREKERHREKETDRQRERGRETERELLKFTQSSCSSSFDSSQTFQSTRVSVSVNEITCHSENVITGKKAPDHI